MTVDQPELDTWRIQTIRVASLVRRDSQVEKRKQQIVSAPRLADELRQIASKFHEHHTAEEAMADVEMLLRRATDLALVLRSCRTRYAWWQNVDGANVDADAAGRIHSYGAGLDLRAGAEARCVLFGPVYKEVDGKAVILRKGKVLCT